MWQNKYKRLKYIGIAIASSIGSYVGVNYVGRSQAKVDGSPNNVENEVWRVTDEEWILFAEF